MTNLLRNSAIHFSTQFGIRRESENAKLKKLVAERDLEIETMKEINRRKW